MVWHCISILKSTSCLQVKERFEKLHITVTLSTNIYNDLCERVFYLLSNALASSKDRWKDEENPAPCNASDISFILLVLTIWLL